jgi:hypothetical protein
MSKDSDITALEHRFSSSYTLSLILQSFVCAVFKYKKLLLRIRSRIIFIAGAVFL